MDEQWWWDPLINAHVTAQFKFTRQIAFQPKKRSLEQYRFERRIKRRSWIKTSIKLHGYIKTGIQKDHIEVHDTLCITLITEKRCFFQVSENKWVKEAEACADTGEFM